MATDLIRFDLLVQDALRSVVRRVLTQAARDGLPGEHHFFISFRTHAPGVRLSSRMREQYPEEMTIVLQHQFWDLVVGDLGFEVGLSFHGKAEMLAIPFAAITGFFDPSVDFGLKFELDADSAQETPLHALAPPQQGLTAAAETPRLAAVDKVGDKAADKVKPRGSGSEPAEVGPSRGTGEQPEAGARPAPPAPPAAVQPAAPANEPNVVSIDAFRKKP